jgi:hypothetical protein
VKLNRPARNCAPNPAVIPYGEGSVEVGFFRKRNEGPISTNGRIVDPGSLYFSNNGNFHVPIPSLPSFNLCPSGVIKRRLIWSVRCKALTSTEKSLGKATSSVGPAIKLWESEYRRNVLSPFG